VSQVFYVYEHWRPDTGLPFYVGKGKGDRAHEITQSRRNPHYLNVLSKLKGLGHSVEVRIVFSRLEEKMAHTLEISQISYWRARGLSLTNMTDGGDGVTGYVPDEAARAYISVCTKEALADPEVKARHTAANIAFLSKPEVRKKISMGVVTVFADPAKRKHHGDCVKKAMAVPGVKEKMSASLKLVKSTPEARKLCGQRAKTSHARPEVREKIGTRTREALLDPAIRRKMSEQMKLSWVRRKAEKLLENNK